MAIFVLILLILSGFVKETEQTEEVEEDEFEV